MTTTLEISAHFICKFYLQSITATIVSQCGSINRLLTDRCVIEVKSLRIIKSLFLSYVARYVLADVKCTIAQTD